MPEDHIVRELMMVLAAQLSFDSKRYFCYDVREGQSAIGPRGASIRMALSLAQLLAVGPRWMDITSIILSTGIKGH